MEDGRHRPTVASYPGSFPLEKEPGYEAKANSKLSICC